MGTYRYECTKCGAEIFEEGAEPDWAANRIQAGEDALAELERLYSPCHWSEDEDGIWNADCGGGVFVFNDNGPKTNGFKHCPYCGSTLEEHEFQEPNAPANLPPEREARREPLRRKP